MSYLGTSTRTLFCWLAILAVSHGLSQAQAIQRTLCELVLHEERLDLKEWELELSLARSDFAAFEKIFKLVDELWRDKAIERMAYLKSKHDRDAAKLALERADLIVERQEALIEQYRLACETLASGDTAKAHSRDVQRAHLRYRKAHCDSLSKAVEVAEVMLDFDRLLMTSVINLRAAQAAAQQDVILAERDVEKQETRLKDSKRRVEACRHDLVKESQPRPD
jgi:hypothetical protein